MTKKKEEASGGFDFNRSFETDQDLETEGAWDELYMDGQSLKVLVARSSNVNYKKMMRQLLRRNKRKLDREDEASIALFERLTIQVMAKTILLGWGDLIVNKKVLGYSVENAELVLRNEDFRKEIVDISESFELYKAEKEEEMKGN